MRCPHVCGEDEGRYQRDWLALQHTRVSGDNLDGGQRRREKVEDEGGVRELRRKWYHKLCERQNANGPPVEELGRWLLSSVSCMSSSRLYGQVRFGGDGSSLHSGIEFGRRRTGEG